MGIYWIEKNEKWVKYLLGAVPKKIKTLDGFTDVTIEMAEKTFAMLYSIKLEWGR